MNLYKVKKQHYMSGFFNDECYEVIYVIAPTMDIVANEHPNASSIEIVSKDIKILK